MPTPKTAASRQSKTRKACLQETLQSPFALAAGVPASSSRRRSPSPRPLPQSRLSSVFLRPKSEHRSKIDRPYMTEHVIFAKRFELPHGKELRDRTSPTAVFRPLLFLCRTSDCSGEFHPAVRYPPRR